MNPRHYPPAFREKAIASVRRYRSEKGWRYRGVKQAADEAGVTVMSIWRWLKQAEAERRSAAPPCRVGSRRIDADPKSVPGQVNRGACHRTPTRRNED